MIALAAWWSAWKWVAILIVVCLLLILLNVWQWKRAITADLRADNKSLTEAMDQVREIATNRTRDDSILITELGELVERGRETRILYRQAAIATPLPVQCAPGQARVDAVNAGLSGSIPE